MRLHRFFIQQPLGEEIVIRNKDLLKQWFTVFRYTEGDTVILFNGESDDFVYEIVSHTKQEAIFRFLYSEKNISTETSVTLAVSLIKKDNLELIVQKGTELGVSSFVFFLSQRSEKKQADMERLTRIAIEATEQSGRRTVPRLQGVFELKEALETLVSSGVVYILNMNGDSVSSVLKKIGGVHTSVSLCIGPEGGWTEEEKEYFQEKGITSLSLTSTVLRAETAAIVGAYSFLEKR